VAEVLFIPFWRSQPRKHHNHAYSLKRFLPYKPRQNTDHWVWIGAKFMLIGLFCDFSGFNGVVVSFHHVAKYLNTSETKIKMQTKLTTFQQSRIGGRIVLTPRKWSSCESAGS
jgi:hypothetical protein